MFISNVAERFVIQHTGVVLLGPKEDKHFEWRKAKRAMWAGEGFVVCSLDTKQKPRVHHLVRLVEKQAEVGEDNPELLPAVAVLEFPQQIS